MKMPLLALAFTLLALPVGVDAQQAERRLTITGTSTLRDWQCLIPSYQMVVQPGAGFSEPVLAGQKAVEDLRLDIDVRSIDCGIDKMNGHLRKALKVEDHPSIAFDLSLYDLTSGASGLKANATGTITVAGSARPVTLEVQLVEGEGGTLRARGEHVINMRDHDVEPPSLMLGTLKVGERVTVVFDVDVVPTGTAVAARPSNR